MTEKIPTHPIPEEAQRNKEAHDATRILVIAVGVASAVISLICTKVCDLSENSPAESPKNGSVVITKTQSPTLIDVKPRELPEADTNLQKEIKKQLFRENYHLPYVPRKRDFSTNKKDPIML